MANLEVVQGDTGYYLYFTVQDAEGSAFDLTDYTITLKAWVQGDPDNNFINGLCEIVNAVAGTCKYLVSGGDFSVSGNDNRGELEFTKSGVKESTQSFPIKIQESA